MSTGLLQVMNSEIKRTLGVTDEEATDKLLNLSPYETKNLLHHIMSGQEYDMAHTGSRLTIVPASCNISKAGETSRRVSFGNENERKFSSAAAAHAPASGGQQSPRFGSSTSLGSLAEAEEGDHRSGIWVRRRLLDGSLNRGHIWSIIY